MATLRPDWTSRTGAAVLAAAFLLTSTLSAVAESGVQPTLAVAQIPGTNSFAETRHALVEFDSSPFPYRGSVPGQDKPFFEVDRGGRLGRYSPRGGILYEDRTYSDRRVLIAIPRGFDETRPALLVLYLHGMDSRLDRDVVERHGIARQVADSDLNAVLVAPQFAVDALDPSAGRFWQPGHLATFLTESAVRLAGLHGNPGTREVFERAPVVIVAHGGGAVPAAHALAVGGAGPRIRGLILLDPLLTEDGRLARWIAERGDAFVVSAFPAVGRAENGRLLSLLTARSVTAESKLPDRFKPGQVVLFNAGARATPRDFLTKAWTPDPLRALLNLIPGYDRRTPDGDDDPSRPVVDTPDGATLRHAGAEFRPVATETLLNWLARPQVGAERTKFDGPVPRAKPQ